jgi:hypothetical protein
MFSRFVAAIRVAIPIFILAAMAIASEAGMRWGG